MAKLKTKRTTTREKVVEQFREYCKHSTMHGMYYLYKPTHWSETVTWMAIICLSGVFCGYLIRQIIMQFVKDPTVTLVESTHYPTNKIPFPAVVFCDSDLVYGPRTTPLVDILTRRGYSTMVIDDFFNSILTVTDMEINASNTEMATIHNVLEEIDFSFLSILEMLAKPCDVLLVKCMWRSYQHQCSDMFHRVLTYRGYCCRFDMNHFRRKTEGKFNYQASHERTDGLEIIFNGKTILANGTSADGDVDMFIIDANDLLTVVDPIISLVPKAYFDVSISLLAMDSSDDIKALSKDSRKCILPTDSDVSSSFYSGCLSNKLVRRTLQQCRCIPFYVLQTESMVGYDNCTWDKYECVMKARREFSGSPAEQEAFLTCYQKCDYVDYDPQVEYVQLAPSSSIMDGLRESFVNESYSEIAVHFADRSCMKYRREVLFTWDQMLANIGGVFGLCMGGSIISIIELIWLAFDVTYAIVTNKNQSKTDSQTSDVNAFKKVFTVTQNNASAVHKINCKKVTNIGVAK